MGTSIGKREIELNYLKQIAEAVDLLGYHSVLVPTGKSCADPWIISSVLAAITKNIKFLVAVRPSVQTPTVLARMASSFERISNGRLLLNIVSGGVPSELAGDGVHLNHDQRYSLTDEFLEITKNILRGHSVDFDGDHFKVKNAELLFPTLQQPPIYFSGASRSAMEVAAKYADKYFMWGNPMPINLKMEK
ncbi:hypothetical protein COK86_25380 [Bacillus cereus]|uniref:Luciferase-like domain-containing protein n=1 Tax=Bacillus cereus TaxID=1396 RepID=A0A2B3TT66_BACCE|nr:hypothetical protein COK86_25380 [Bacillus cereus]